MAILRITTEDLLAALHLDGQDIVIVGADYDMGIGNGVFELRVIGADVPPDVAEVAIGERERAASLVPAR